jgi:hypothetical protein
MLESDGLKSDRPERRAISSAWVSSIRMVQT